MSCSAKIPIYAVFSAALFPDYAALVMIGLYVFGILVGVLIALLMNHSMYRGNPVPFVMELPNYRFPSPKTVAMLLWDKAKDFITKAFTIIFFATLVIWFLSTFDIRMNPVESQSSSILASVGAFIAPIFTPLGFGDWRISTSLITGFIAKESVISTLGILTSESGGVADAISQLFTARSGLSFLVFTLLYTPCVAAVSAICRELHSKFKGIGVAVFQCVTAWIFAFIVYQIAGLFMV